MFWNCQGIGPKRKELDLYLKENNFDIVVPKRNVPYPENRLQNSRLWYNKNDRSTGAGAGVAFLVNMALLLMKEYRDTDFNIIIDNET